MFCKIISPISFNILDDVAMRELTLTPDYGVHLEPHFLLMAHTDLSSCCVHWEIIPPFVAITCTWMWCGLIDLQCQIAVRIILGPHERLGI